MTDIYITRFHQRQAKFYEINYIFLFPSSIHDTVKIHPKLKKSFLKLFNILIYVLKHLDRFALGKYDVLFRYLPRYLKLSLQFPNYDRNYQTMENVLYFGRKYNTPTTYHIAVVVFSYIAENQIKFRDSQQLQYELEKSLEFFIDYKHYLDFYASMSAVSVIKNLGLTKFVTHENLFLDSSLRFIVHKQYDNLYFVNWFKIFIKYSNPENNYNEIWSILFSMLEKIKNPGIEKILNIIDLCFPFDVLTQVKDNVKKKIYIQNLITAITLIEKKLIEFDEIEANDFTYKTEIFTKIKSLFEKIYNKNFNLDFQLFGIEEYFQICQFSYKTNFHSTDSSFPLILPIFNSVIQKEIAQILEEETTIENADSKMKYLDILKKTLSKFGYENEILSRLIEEKYVSVLLKYINKEIADPPNQIYLNLFVNINNPIIEKIYELFKIHFYKLAKPRSFPINVLQDHSISKIYLNEKFFKDVLSSFEKKKKIYDFDKFCVYTDLSINLFGHVNKKLVTRSIIRFFKMLTLNESLASNFINLMRHTGNIWDISTLFHLEKLLIENVYGKIQDQYKICSIFNIFNYQALKYGLVLKKPFMHYIQGPTCNEKDSIILVYLLEKKLMEFDDIIEFLNKIKSSYLLLDIFSMFFEMNIHLENPEKIHEIFNEKTRENLNLWLEKGSFTHFKKLQIYGILSLINENPPNLSNITDLNNFSGDCDNYYRIPKLFLKQKTISKEVELIIHHCLKRYNQLFETGKLIPLQYIKFLIELLPLKIKSPNFFKKILSEVFLLRKAHEKFLDNSVLKNELWLFYSFLLETPKDIENRKEFIKFYRKQILKFNFIPINCDDLQKILNSLKKSSKLDQAILGILEKNLVFYFNDDVETLKYIYLLFSEVGIGSSFFLEKLEKKIFREKKRIDK